MDADELNDEFDTAEVEGTEVEFVEANEGTGEAGNEGADEGTDTEPAAPVEVSAEEAAAVAAAERAKQEAAYNEAVTAFTSAVEKGVTDEAVDQNTGTLPEVLVAPIMQAYANLPGAKGKNAGKAYLQDKMQEAMLQASPEQPELYVRARSYLELFRKANSAGTSAGIVKVPVDPTEAHVAAVTAIYLAANLVIPPAGVADNWQDQVRSKAESLADQVATYREWLVANADKAADERTDEPDVHDIVKASARIAVGRARPGRKASTGATSTGTSTPRVSTGTRRDVAKHILSAFEGKNVGDFMLIAEIGKHSSAEYGDDHPSTGALAARLFPASGKSPNIPGIQPELSPEGKKGARKVA